MRGEQINHEIQAKELRVIGEDGTNIGVISKDDALKHAKTAALDLIVISPKANPPVARIMDYGKYLYDQKKKQKEAKAKAHVTETKVVQIKIGTGEHDLNLKAGNVSKWLAEGHRVKIDLYLRGRSKYMEQAFLKARFERFLTIVSPAYKIADPIKKSPKGLSMVIERDKTRAQTNEEKERVDADSAPEVFKEQERTNT